MVDAVVQHGLWAAVTRLGEAQILLPAFAAGTLWLAFAPGASRRAGADGTPEADPPSRDSARAWVAGIVAATGLTTASKVAFLGFGIGSIALDFTGFSGHSMYAMAILPVLAALVAGARGAALGVLLALAVLVSRVELNAHSWSEALSGALLGAAVAGWTLARYLRRPGALRAPWWLPLGLAAWLTLLPWRAPPAHAHQMVVAMSLWLADRNEPYTRHELLTGQIGRTRLQ
jgi:membrane-associated phospholipid phosphatase